MATEQATSIRHREAVGSVFCGADIHVPLFSIYDQLIED
jgi:hypothetical protein